MDAENEMNAENVDVELFFRKPPEITNFELVKTIWIDPKEETNSTNEPTSEHEPKSLQPLALQPLQTPESESGGSSCSHSEVEQLPDDILNEPLDDEVFEEEEENVQTDLLFRQPKNSEMELAYTISKSAEINLDELEFEDEEVEVDLLFREPTDRRFELVYTIPMMEDVSIDSQETITFEDIPPSEELDNVVEEVTDVAELTEFTFKPVEKDEQTETESFTTVLEANAGEGARDFIERVKLTSNDTLDDLDDDPEEETFQNSFVKSVDSKTPTPTGDNYEIEDSSVSDVLKDAAEKLQIIRNYSADLESEKDTINTDVQHVFIGLEDEGGVIPIIQETQEYVAEIGPTQDNQEYDSTSKSDLEPQSSADGVVETSTFEAPAVFGLEDSEDIINKHALETASNQEFSKIKEPEVTEVSENTAENLNEEVGESKNPEAIDLVESGENAGIEQNAGAEQSQKEAVEETSSFKAPAVIGLEESRDILKDPLLETAPDQENFNNKESEMTEIAEITTPIRLESSGDNFIGTDPEKGTEQIKGSESSELVTQEVIGLEESGDILKEPALETVTNQELSENKVSEVTEIAENITPIGLECSGDNFIGTDPEQQPEPIKGIESSELDVIGLEDSGDEVKQSQLKSSEDQEFSELKEHDASGNVDETGESADIKQDDVTEIVQRETIGLEDSGLAEIVAAHEKNLTSSDIDSSVIPEDAENASPEAIGLESSGDNFIGTDLEHEEGQIDNCESYVLETAAVIGLEDSGENLKDSVQEDPPEKEFSENKESEVTGDVENTTAIGLESSGEHFIGLEQGQQAASIEANENSEMEAPAVIGLEDSGDNLNRPALETASDQESSENKEPDASENVEETEPVSSAKVIALESSGDCEEGNIKISANENSVEPDGADKPAHTEQEIPTIILPSETTVTQLEDHLSETEEKQNEVESSIKSEKNVIGLEDSGDTFRDTSGLAPAEDNEAEATITTDFVPLESAGDIPSENEIKEVASAPDVVGLEEYIIGNIPNAPVVNDDIPNVFTPEVANDETVETFSVTAEEASIPVVVELEPIGDEYEFQRPVENFSEPSDNINLEESGAEQVLLENNMFTPLDELEPQQKILNEKAEHIEIEASGDEFIKDHPFPVENEQNVNEQSSRVETVHSFIGLESSGVGLTGAVSDSVANNVKENTESPDIISLEASGDELSKLVEAREIITESKDAYSTDVPESRKTVSDVIGLEEAGDKIVSNNVSNVMGNPDESQLALEQADNVPELPIENSEQETVAVKATESCDHVVDSQKTLERASSLEEDIMSPEVLGITSSQTLSDYLPVISEDQDSIPVPVTEVEETSEKLVKASSLEEDVVSPEVLELDDRVQNKNPESEVTAVDASKTEGDFSDSPDSRATETFMEKLVTVTENLLPAGDKLSEERIQEIRENETISQPGKEEDDLENANDPDDETIVEKIVSMAESSLPIEAVISTEDGGTSDQPAQNAIPDSEETTVDDSQTEEIFTDDNVKKSKENTPKAENDTEINYLPGGEEGPEDNAEKRNEAVSPNDETSEIKQDLENLENGASGPDNNVQVDEAAQEDPTDPETVDETTSKISENMPKAPDTEDDNATEFIEAGLETTEAFGDAEHVSYLDANIEKLVAMADEPLPVDELVSIEERPEEVAPAESTGEDEDIFRRDRRTVSLTGTGDQNAPIQVIFVGDGDENPDANADQERTSEHNELIESDKESEEAITKNEEDVDQDPIQSEEPLTSQEGESSIGNKIVAVVGSVLLGGAVIPYGVLASNENEDAHADREVEETGDSTRDRPEEETFVSKLTSMVENILPSTNDENPEAVSMVENVLPVNTEGLDESKEDNPDAPTAEAHSGEKNLRNDKTTDTRERDPEEETILNKLVENALPTGVTGSFTEVSAPDAQELDETVVDHAGQNDTSEVEDAPEKSAGGTVIEKFTSMIESILPVQAPTQPENAESHIDQETGGASEIKDDQNQPEEFSAEHQGKFEVSAEPDQESAEFQLEAKKDQDKETIENSEDAKKETVMEKLVSLVENILPVEAVLPSDSTVTKNSEDKKELETQELSSKEIKTSGQPEYVPETSEAFVSDPEIFQRVKRASSTEPKTQKTEPHAPIFIVGQSTEDDEQSIANVIDELVHEDDEKKVPEVTANISVSASENIDDSTTANAVPKTEVSSEQLQVATVEFELESAPEEESAAIPEVQEPLEKVEVQPDLSQNSPAPHKIIDLHFNIPKDHEDYGNDYVPFGTESSEESQKADGNQENQEEEDVVAELNFHPIRQWRDEDVISLQSLKSLVAEVGCITDVDASDVNEQDEESTLKILKVVPSEPSLLELDFTNDPKVIHVPIPLMEPATMYLEEMVEWIIADAVKEVSEMEVVTESEISEMAPQVSESTCPIPEPLADLKLPVEDDEKTPEPEPVVPGQVQERIIPIEVEQAPTIPQRPPRAPKSELPKVAKPLDDSKSRVRFAPLNIKLGRTYSEEQQKELVESLERPLTIITQQKPPEKPTEDIGALSPLSPNTLAEYEEVPMMDMQSVPHSPQEKQEEIEALSEIIEEPQAMKEVEKPVESAPEKDNESLEAPEIINEPIRRVLVETKIMGPGKSLNEDNDDDDDGSECLDSIGDLSERTIQRFNTSSEQMCALLVIVMICLTFSSLF